jgi:hypothetical protein
MGSAGFAGPIGMGFTTGSTGAVFTGGTAGITGGTGSFFSGTLGVGMVCLQRQNRATHVPNGDVRHIVARASGWFRATAVGQRFFRDLSSSAMTCAPMRRMRAAASSVRSAPIVLAREP